MPMVFCIQRNASILGSWNLDSGQASYHSDACIRDGMLVVEESTKFDFVLRSPQDEFEYNISVGDVSLGDMGLSEGGVRFGGDLYWQQHPYFESARGHTQIVIRTRLQSDENAQWSSSLVVTIYVLPSKIGEERYEFMSADLREVSRGLLMDLYGKSTQTKDLRFSTSRSKRLFESCEDELASIVTLLDRIAPIWESISRRPASRITSINGLQTLWGGEQLTPSSLQQLARKGFSKDSSLFPIRVMGANRVEGFDLPEHKVFKAFLCVLAKRLKRCSSAALRHIAAIHSERPLRDVRLGDSPTLFEAVDTPKIARLEQAVITAKRCFAQVSAWNSSYFLKGVPPDLAATQCGNFQRSSEYEYLLGVLYGYMHSCAAWLDGDDVSSITKLTSRIFEQWCFVQIIEGFRRVGIELREWTDTLRQNLRSRFIIDFERGLTFEGSLGPDLRIRFRYEPWIYGSSAAEQAGESLCRGTTSGVAWCPDVVIECLHRSTQGWSTVYGIAIDCKYTNRLGEYHWNDTAKYLEIRSTSDRRQVVKQLCLISLGSQAGIQSEDPSIAFGELGPTCGPEDSVRFRITIAPAHNEKLNTDPFNLFARGVVGYVRKYFLSPV